MLVVVLVLAWAAVASSEQEQEVTSYLQRYGYPVQQDRGLAIR